MALDLLKQAQAKGTRLLLPWIIWPPPSSRRMQTASSRSTRTSRWTAWPWTSGLKRRGLRHEIRAAKTLLWNGPMGVFEMPLRQWNADHGGRTAEAADRVPSCWWVVR